MRLSAILFDLDDTLLSNNMDTFLPRYLPLLAHHVEDLIESDRFLSELMAGTQAMITNKNRELTNSDAFWSRFSRGVGISRSEIEPVIEKFYLEKFDQLDRYTKARPEARRIVEWCFDQGLTVVVATNPLFPRIAIEARLRWASLPVSEYAFDLVTTYENMHAAKPHPDYYREILERTGADAKTTMMVGDDWVNDIEPAASLGMRTYWLAGNGRQPPSNHIKTDGQGSLESLHELLRNQLI